MDDVTVGTGGHHVSPRGFNAVVVGDAVDSGDSALQVGQLVFVFNDEKDNRGSVVGGNDDAVFLVTGDGAEASLFVFDTATQRDPLVGFAVVGADAGTTVRVAVVGSHGVSKVDFAVGPHDGAGDGSAVRLPVIGGVVEFAVGAHHVRLDLHVLEALHTLGHLHGSDFVKSVVSRHVSHLRVANGGHQQD